MIRWIPYAFVRIAVFFMVGICFGIYYPNTLTPTTGRILFFILTVGYCFIVFCFRKRWLFSGRAAKVVAGFAGLMVISIAGYLNVQMKTDSNRPNHLIHVSSPITFLKIVISSIPEEKEKSWKFEGNVQACQSNGQWKPSEAKILLYLAKGQADVFEYGDVLLVKGHPQLIPGPTNPEEFDYRRYLSFKNIYHQQFVKAEDVRRIGHEPLSWITYFALRRRQWADASLKKNISGEREQGLASALVLGVTEGLDNELLSAYKATGTMHVLAVSGLHVGILYGILLFLLKHLNRIKFGPWIIAVISILVLWCYAFVTGLSPSVLRAVTMFSFVALAKPARLRTNMYNSLAASAFFILLYDPFMLMTVGFQLSYLAVLGIVYLQPPLYNLWEPNNRLLDEIWKVSAVSIAAQIATFALGLLYFHQFPNYFLLSNLFVIPGSFIVLIVGLVMLVTHAVHPVAAALGFILEWIIKILNHIVFALEKLPFSLIENVYISTIQCWLIFGFIVVVILLLNTRKFKWVMATFILTLIFSFTQWMHWQQDVNTEKVIVYNVPGHSAIDYNDRGKIHFVSDSLLKNDHRKINFHLLPGRMKAGVNGTIHPDAFFQQQLPGCLLTVWRGKSFLQIVSPDFPIPNGLMFDVVIISNNAVSAVGPLLEGNRIKHLVIDSSNSRYRATTLLQQAVSHSNIHSVLHQGAFQLRL